MSRFVNPPQARTPALTPLSRDHYVGLVQSRRLIKAAHESPAQRRAAVAEFLDAYHRDVAPHFADEERLLAELVTPDEHRQLLQEHDDLRSLAERLRQQRRRIEPDAGLMQAIGATLRRHIRWEERELFPAVESRAAEAELELLEEQTQVLETQRGRHIG